MTSTYKTCFKQSFGVDNSVFISKLETSKFEKFIPQPDGACFT